MINFIVMCMPVLVLIWIDAVLGMDEIIMSKTISVTFRWRLPLNIIILIFQVRYGQLDSGPFRSSVPVAGRRGGYR